MAISNLYISLRDKLGATLLWLMVANVAVFVALHILALSGNIASTCLGEMMVSGGFQSLLYKPWSLFTYMFTQYEFLHLAMNMLGLWVFASLMADRPKQMLTAYIAGGLAGGLCAMAVQSAGVGDTAVAGASASISAIMAAATMLMPNKTLYLALIGELRLIYITIAIVVFMVLCNLEAPTVTHVTHAGGLIMGVVVGTIWRHKSQMVKLHRKHAVSEESLDELLDKMRRSGFNSLTSSQRARLFELSKNIGKR